MWSPATQLKLMKPGAVMVDVAIDQGGCFETSHPTTHREPTFEVDGITHYCVANMPGAVPITSTQALTNATLPYAIAIADHGLAGAIRRIPGLRPGVNVAAGQVTHAAVAEGVGMEYIPVDASARARVRARVKAVLLLAVGAFALLAAHAVAARRPTKKKSIAATGDARRSSAPRATTSCSGTPGRDVIWGGPGDDTIYGSLGNDLICGGAATTPSTAAAATTKSSAGVAPTASSATSATTR